MKKQQQSKLSIQQYPALNKCLWVIKWKTKTKKQWYEWENKMERVIYNSKSISFANYF